MDTNEHEWRHHSEAAANGARHSGPQHAVSHPGVEAIPEGWIASGVLRPGRSRSTSLCMAQQFSQTALQIVAQAGDS